MYGMSLNFKANKSELIVGFVGAGAKRARAALAETQNQITIENDSENVVLRVVQSYKHVGSFVSVCKGIAEEVAMRCGVMRSESLRLCRHILSNRALPVHKKLHVSRLTFCRKVASSAGLGQFWAMLSISSSILPC